MFSRHFVPTGQRYMRTLTLSIRYKMPQRHLCSTYKIYCSYAFVYISTSSSNYIGFLFKYCLVGTHYLKNMSMSLKRLLVSTLHQSVVVATSRTLLQRQIDFKYPYRFTDIFETSFYVQFCVIYITFDKLFR